MRWMVVAVLLLASCDRLLGLTQIGDPGFSDARSSDAQSSGDARGSGWTLVQSTGLELMSTLPINPTQAGDLVVVAIGTYMEDVVQVTDGTPSDTYAVVPGSSVVDSTSMRGLSLWYAAGVASGATTINVAVSASNQPVAIVAWEFSGIATSSSLGTSAGSGNQGLSAAPASPSITTVRDGELVVAAAMANQSITGLASPSEFHEDNNIDNDGWAHLTSPSTAGSAYQAIWNQMPAGTYCSAAVAFYATE